MATVEWWPMVETLRSQLDILTPGACSSTTVTHLITLEMLNGDPWHDWPLIVTRFEWLRDVAPPHYLKKRIVTGLEPVTPVTSVTRRCAQCGRLFEPARYGPTGKYCGAACKQAAYRERKAA